MRKYLVLLLALFLLVGCTPVSSATVSDADFSYLTSEDDVALLISGIDVTSLNITSTTEINDDSGEICINDYLTQWASVDELKEFVDSTGLVLVFGGACYDRARAYQQMAFQKGKIVNIQTAWWDEYNRYFTKMQLNDGECHAFISAVVDRDIYWIEPQTAEMVYYGRHGMGDGSDIIKFGIIK